MIVVEAYYDGFDVICPCSPTDDDPSNIKLESDFVIYVSEAIL